MYDERAENAYNTSNRKMTGNLGNWLIDNYDTVGTVSQDQQQRYSDIADKAMSSSWDDFDRQLAKSQSEANARAYNHFGSLTNTPALYDQETFTRHANAGATDLGSVVAKYKNSLVNQDINRQLQAWKQYSNMYNKAGEDITTLDAYNWNIRNQNKDRQYTNDISKFQAKVARAQMLADLMDPSKRIMQQFGSFMGNKINGNTNTNNESLDTMESWAKKYLQNMQTGSTSSNTSAIGNALNSYMNGSGSSGGSAISNGLSEIFGNNGTSGLFDNISSNLGSSATSDGGSWISSIGSWFKGLGGK